MIKETGFTGNYRYRLLKGVTKTLKNQANTIFHNDHVPGTTIKIGNVEYVVTKTGSYKKIK